MTPAHRHWATNKREASKSGKADPQGQAPAHQGFPQNDQEGLRVRSVQETETGELSWMAVSIQLQLVYVFSFHFSFFFLGLIPHGGRQ